MAATDQATPEVTEKSRAVTDDEPVVIEDEDDKKSEEKKGKKGGKRNKGEGKGKGKGEGNRGRAPSGPTAYNGYRLNVKNLSDETKDADQLKALFSTHGNLTDVQVKTRDDGSSRGVGFVVFEKSEDAQSAILALHDKEIGGKKLAVKPAERRPDDGQEAWGKGKGKGADMMQQYMAMQQAYYSAYQQYWSSAAATNYGGAAAASYGGAVADPSGADQKPGEESTMPGAYIGILKNKLRYGKKSSYLVCAETHQYLKCDVHIENPDIPEGAKEGDKIKFTVATMYKPWTWEKEQQTYVQLPSKGYPKAKTAAKA